MGVRGYPVLVVHEDAAARFLIAEALESEGFRAVSGGYFDALAALAKLNGEPPRVVLLDLDGDRAANAFAAELARHHRDVPIIGLSTSPNLRDGSAVGAAALLPEPFELDHLLEAVTRFCRN